MREEYELMGQDFTTRGKRLNEMIPALRALWRGGWVSWSGEYYQVPEMMIEPHPPAPVPIHVRRRVRRGIAARGADCAMAGSAMRTAGTKRSPTCRSSTKLRREYGRDSEPFDIMLALLEPPSPDLYKRAEDVGITAVMCAPWMRDGIARRRCRALPGTYRAVRREHHRKGAVMSDPEAGAWEPRHEY